MATVLEAENSGWVHSSGAEGIPGNTTVTWKVTLRVDPAAGDSFDARLKWSFVAPFSPSVGDRMAVLYDPEDHEKLVIDEPEETTAGSSEGQLATRIIRQRADVGIAKLRAAGFDQAADTLQVLRDLGLLNDLSWHPDKIELLANRRL